MASSANPHAAVVGAPLSDSPSAANKAGPAVVWNFRLTAKEPVVEPIVDEDGKPIEKPIMDADSWPALPGLASPPPPQPAATKASPKAAPPPSTGALMSPVSLVNSGAPDDNPGNEAPVRNPVARRALVMPAGDELEKSAPAPELPPVSVPNARSNGSDHHQNGRFGSNPHGRGGGWGNRRGNGGGGGRRGHEPHGNFDGHRRGGGRRDGHGSIHQQRGHQSTYIRAHPLAVVVGAPPPPPPFVSPTQTPPYAAPMGFPEVGPHVYYYRAPSSEGIQGLPFVPQAILVDPVQKDLLKQIDYYFSDDNLCKDIFLRQNMDEQGWVPLSLIAGFPQVQKLTKNIQFVSETVLLSTIVEVQFDKVRRRGTWENWLLPKPKFSSGSSGSSPPVTSNMDPLMFQFQSVGLEGPTYYTNVPGIPREALLTRSTTSVGYHTSTLGELHSNESGPPFGQESTRNLLRSDTF